MTPAAESHPGATLRVGALAMGAVGVALLATGFAGGLNAAWGYALFTAATVLLGAGASLIAVFWLSRAGDTQGLARASSTLLWAGAAAYVLSVCALAGYYVHEAVQGRMEMHWIVFGPTVLIALVVLDVGLYRKLVRNNLPTWQRFRRYISRDQGDPAAMRRTLVDDVIVHKSLYRTSKFRWLRHTLIFWGFMGMFAAELAAVFLREAVPAFGWRDVWRESGHPIRLVFDFVYDFTGLMVLVGCLLALAWRVRVNGTPEQKFSDTPTVVFLLFVVASGFVVEGLRIAFSSGDGHHAASFVGVAFAHALSAANLSGGKHYDVVWLVHVVSSCVFIAYVPLKRLVHTCATPMGRLMNSQSGMLAAKKRGVLGAMLLGRERPVLVATPPTQTESARQ